MCSANYECRENSECPDVSSFSETVKSQTLKDSRDQLTIDGKDVTTHSTTTHSSTTRRVCKCLRNYLPTEYGGCGRKFLIQFPNKIAYWRKNFLSEVKIFWLGFNSKSLVTNIKTLLVLTELLNTEYVVNQNVVHLHLEIKAWSLNPDTSTLFFTRTLSLSLKQKCFWINKLTN